MPATTATALLPYPLTSDVPNVPSDIQALANRLEMLLADTGWVTMGYNGTTTAAVTTPLAYRVHQGVVYVNGDFKLSSGSFPAGAANQGITAAGVIPSGYLPSRLAAFPVVGTNGAPGFVTLSSSGSTLQFTNGANAVTNVYVNFSYVLG